MKKWMALCLACLLPLTAARADHVLRVRGDVPEGFASSLTIEKDSNYLEPQMLMEKLEANSMAYDVFEMLSSDADIRTIINEGYCLDLSGSEIIREAVSRMHPAIAAFISRGEAIYAVPSSLSFRSPLMCDEAVWRELGYTEADVPKTFPAFLDFLETWIVRNENNVLDVRLRKYWVPELYNEHTYADWLVDWLMRSWLEEAQYAGEAPRFNTPELVELLERSRTIGEQIVRSCEPSMTNADRNKRELFSESYNDGGWAKRDTWMIDMRTSKDQPTLATSSLWAYAAYAGTEHPEEAIRLLEAKVLSENGLQVSANKFLYADAEPVPNASQESNLRGYRNRIAILEHRLAGDDTPVTEYLELTDSDYETVKSYDSYTPLIGYQGMAERLKGMSDDAVREELAYNQGLLEQEEANQWDYPPEELAAYKQYAQSMIIEEPEFFTQGSQARSDYYDLVKQFSSGKLSAQELVTRLDEMVQKEIK